MAATATNLTPTAAQVGFTVEVTAQGFNPNVPLTVTVGTTVATIADPTPNTGPNGSKTIRFIVPSVASGERKVTVTDVPQVFNPFAPPPASGYHTVVVDDYLDVSPSGEVLPPGGLSGGGGVGPPITPPGVPQVPGTGGFDPNPTTTVTALLVESAASVRTTEYWDKLRGIVNTGGEFSKVDGAYNAIEAALLTDGTTAVVTETVEATVVDVLGFPFVAGAAAVLLLEWGFGWVMTQVANHFPDPNVFGWHPLGFIIRGIRSLGDQLEKSATDLGDRVGNAFYQPIKQILGLFQHSANVAAKHANGLAYITTTLIPNSRKLAVADAKAYTDGVAAGLDPAVIERKITGINNRLNVTDANVALNTSAISELKALIPVGLIATLATLTSGLGALKTKVDTCMVDACDTTGPNGLRTQLLALLALLTDAGELAFIAEAIRDPLGTADTLAPGLDAIDAGAVNLLNSLLSL